MKVSLIAYLSLIITVISLLLLAYHPSWRYHLRVDIDGQYMANAHTFLKYGNLSHQGYNEYQPGAVLFFLFLSPILLLQNTNDAYLTALFAVNCLLILVLAYIFQKNTNKINLVVFALILLFTGPIVLYRFELYVTICLILSLVFWKKQKYYLSYFILGMATLIKIYPALLLPYFLILDFKNKRYKNIIFSLISFFLGVFLFLMAYLYFFQVPALKILSDLNIHSRKPVHVESLWGTAVTLYSKITTGAYALGRGDLGIFGIAKEFVPGPPAFYNYFWIPTLGLIYLWLLLKLKRRSYLNVKICLFIILVFLATSKILTDQYLLWFMLLFPLVDFPMQSKEQNYWYVNLILILITAFLSQYVYPLRYNELLGGFYTDGTWTSIFWVLTARNFFLIVLAVRFFRDIKWSLT